MFKKRRWFEAAWRGDAKALRAMIAAGADVDARDEDGRTALMASAWNAPNEAAIVECARVLMAAGADVDARDGNGRTVLMLAVWSAPTESARIERSRALIEAGAKVDARDDYGQSALIGASRRGSSECVRALLDAGAGDGAGVALPYAVLSGSRACVEMLAICAALRGGKVAARAIAEAAWLAGLQGKLSVAEALLLWIEPGLAPLRAEGFQSVRVRAKVADSRKLKRLGGCYAALLRQASHDLVAEIAQARAEGLESFVDLVGAEMAARERREMERAARCAAAGAGGRSARL